MYWTTEQVADFLEITVEQVYESRRRKEYPGNIGTNRGRRLMFDAEKVQAGPEVAQTTNDPLEALLWTAQGIEAKVGEILTTLQSLTQPSYFVGREEDAPAWLTMTFNNRTDSDGKVWETGEEE